MEESNSYRSSDMRYERNRLSTFKDFPCSQSVSTLRLAQSGFYFTGRGTTCQCHFCDFVHCNWTNGLIPSHCEQRSSNIPMCIPTPLTVSLEIDNVLQPLQASSTVFRFEENRSRVYEFLRLPPVSENDSQFQISSTTENILPHQEAPGSIPHSAGDTASVDSKKDFEFCTSTSSGQKCSRYLSPRSSSCRPVRRSAQSPSDSSSGTESAESMCPSGSRHSSSERERNFSLPGAHLQISRAVRNSSGIPQTYRERFSTFRNWPVQLHQTPERMALAGMFYLGYSDAVQCSFCGGQLRNWQVTEDPRSKHAQEFPNCRLVRQHHSEPPNPEGEGIQGNGILSDEQIASLPAARETRDLSFDQQDIVHACRELSNTLDLRDITTVNILKYFYEESDTQEERFSADDRCLCCVCFAQDVKVMFLPCRHGCCNDCRCSRQLDYCPRCDSLIKSKLKVYI